MNVKMPPSHQTTWQRSSHWLNIGIIVIILAAVIASGVYLAVKNNANNSKQAQVRLVYANSSQGKAYLADKSGSTLADAKFPQNSYVNFEALTPDGAALLSLNSTGPGGDFMMVGGMAKFNEKTLAALRSADYISDSHHFVFTDNQTVNFVSCPADKTCQLVSLNTSTGQSQNVVDIGLAKQELISYAYLLGKSQDGRSVYLRVNGKNKISSSINAIYQIDLTSGKRLTTIPVPNLAGYSLSLSPDAKNLIYQTISLGQQNGTQTTLHVVDTASNKETTVKWQRAAIAERTNVFQWSPDEGKVLFRTGTIRFPADYKGALVPTYMAYLDLNKKQVVDLVTVKDTNLKDIAGMGWLNNDTIIYDQQTASKPADFSSYQDQVYAQDIQTKSAKQFKGPKATLLYANR